MNDTKALAVIEQEYGSLEDFAMTLLADTDKAQVALDETESIILRADACGLPVRVFSRVVNSPMFRTALRTAIVNSEFGFFDEQKHIKEITKIATGHERKVMSPKGSIGMVDQAPGDVIAAGRYLNDLRGTSVDQKGPVGGNSINIQIVNAQVESDPTDTATAGRGTIEVQAAVHQPQRAGALPPPGVLARGQKSVPGTSGATWDAPGSSDEERRANPGIEVEKGALAGESPSQSQARGVERDPFGSEISEQATRRFDQQVEERRKLWQELPDRLISGPPGPRPEEPDSYSGGST